MRRNGLFEIEAAVDYIRLPHMPPHARTRSGARRSLLWIILPVLSFVLFNSVFMPLYVHRGGTLPVPSLTGFRLDEARQVLDSLGLEAASGGTRPDPDAPPGVVVAQNPPADAIVRHGRRIYLTVSGGETLVGVPRLRGLSTRDMRFALERTGLRLGSVEYAPSDSYPEHTVIAQSVPTDSRVARGTAVGVTVSTGKQALNVMVPDLTGRTLGEAGRLLAERGLRIGTISRQPSYDLLPNTVVDQFPRAGQAAAQGASVDLFVVRAGKPQDEWEKSP
ncbi:MAG: PASTA domain-containing protein [Bacteroidota bacterium]